MNAQPLYKLDLETNQYIETKAFRCGICGVVHHKEQAESCCKCYHCGGIVKDKEGLNRSSHSYHQECSDKISKQNHEKWEKEKFEKATKINAKDYAGEMFYSDGFGNDGYCQDWEELLYNLEKVEDLPEYVWACRKIPFDIETADDIIERITENGYEDMYQDIKGRDELQKALDIFTELNKNVVSYEPDYKIAIINIKDVLDLEEFKD